MNDSDLTKLKSELVRREAELASCRKAGHSAYNDFLAARIVEMKTKLENSN